MTNIEKFEEIFGFVPTNIEKFDDYTCIGSDKVCEEQYRKHRPFCGCSDCPFRNWWHREYKSCFRIKEEYK